MKPTQTSVPMFHRATNHVPPFFREEFLRNNGKLGKVCNASQPHGSLQTPRRLSGQGQADSLTSTANALVELSSTFYSLSVHLAHSRLYARICSSDPRTARINDLPKQKHLDIYSRASK
jgi:hypothetical protein